MARKPEKFVDIVLVTLSIAAITVAAASFLRTTDSGRSQVPPQLSASVDSLIGTRLAEITELLPDGSTGHYTPSAAGVVKLVLFFKSTCSACEANAPAWKELSRGQARGFQAVVVSNEGAQTATQWLTRHGIENARIVMPSTPAEITAKWGISAVPTTLVVGSDGTVVFGHVGALNKADLVNISTTLSGQQQQ